MLLEICDWRIQLANFIEFYLVIIKLNISFGVR